MIIKYQNLITFQISFQNTSNQMVFIIMKRLTRKFRNAFIVAPRKRCFILGRSWIRRCSLLASICGIEAYLLHLLSFAAINQIFGLHSTHSVSFTIALSLYAHSNGHKFLRIFANFANSLQINRIRTKSQRWRTQCTQNNRHQPIACYECVSIF